MSALALFQNMKDSSSLPVLALGLAMGTLGVMAVRVINEPASRPGGGYLGTMERDGSDLFSKSSKLLGLAACASAVTALGLKVIVGMTWTSSLGTSALIFTAPVVLTGAAAALGLLFLAGPTAFVMYAMSHRTS